VIASVEAGLPTIKGVPPEKVNPGARGRRYHGPRTVTWADRLPSYT